MKPAPLWDGEVLATIVFWGFIWGVLLTAGVIVFALGRKR